MRLERNYRSTKRILRIADALIGHNVRRKQKELWTENDEGAPVRLTPLRRPESRGGRDRRADSERDRRGPPQAERLRDFLSRQRALARAGAGAAAGEVPYQMVRGQEFYARKEIKDVLAYCQLVNNPRDDIAFERTVNTPPRGIGKKTIDRLNEHAYRHGMPLLEAARDARARRRARQRRRRRRCWRLSRSSIGFRPVAGIVGDVEEVIGTVLEASGYRASLAESDDEQDQNRLANIEELLTDARRIRRAAATSGGNRRGRRRPARSVSRAGVAGE